jgi:hypothetical protein
MQAQPSVITTGDFLYFAPAGKAFVLPAAGIVSATSMPGPLNAGDPPDAIWTTYALGTVKKPAVDKFEGKAIEVKSPMPGTGIIVTSQILRPERGLTMEVEMNELSRLALAGFYKSDLIEIADTSFHPLGGAGSITGWLKRQRYDGINGAYIVDNWWVDLDVTDLSVNDTNTINPKFKFTWLYSALAGSAI